MKTKHSGTFTKAFWAIITTLALCISFAIPVSAVGGNGVPYSRSWLDASNSYRYIDFYEFSSANNGYVKSLQVIVNGSEVFFKGSNAKLTTSLYDDEVGFSSKGDLYFITTDSKVWVVYRGSNNATVVGNGSTLEYDSNNLVTSFGSGNTGNANTNTNNWNNNYNYNNSNNNYSYNNNSNGNVSIDNSNNNNNNVTNSNVTNSNSNNNGNVNVNPNTMVSAGSKEPYIYVYTSGKNTVQAYWEYTNNSYNEVSQIQTVDGWLYYSVTNSWVTSDLINNQSAAYTKAGVLYFVTKDKKIWKIEKGSRNVDFVCNGDALAIDNDHFVTSYHQLNNGNNNSGNNGYNGYNSNTGNNNNNGNGNNGYVNAYVTMNTNSDGIRIAAFYENENLVMNGQQTGSTLYFSATNSNLTYTLFNGQFGFSSSGNLYFITADYRVWTVKRNSSTIEFVDYGDSLELDNRNFVISYHQIKQNSNNNTSKNYPYLTTDSEGNLVMVENNCVERRLAYKEGCLEFNNLTLYRRGVSKFGFAKNCVLFITNEGRVCKFGFGDEKHHCIATSGRELIYDANGFVTGYTTKKGTFNV